MHKTAKVNIAVSQRLGVTIYMVVGRPE